MALSVLFASLSARMRSKSSSQKVANLDVDSAMTKLLKLLVKVLGDVTYTCIKTIIYRYDVTETEPARISCALIANQN